MTTARQILEEYGFTRPSFSLGGKKSTPPPDPEADRRFLKEVAARLERGIVENDPWRIFYAGMLATLLLAQLVTVFLLNDRLLAMTLVELPAGAGIFYSLKRTADLIDQRGKMSVLASVALIVELAEFRQIAGEFLEATLLPRKVRRKWAPRGQARPKAGTTSDPGQARVDAAEAVA